MHEQLLAPAETTLPRLVFFHSPRSGRCRRVEGFIAQALQRRHNHNTFKRIDVSVDERPDLCTAFGVETVPTLLVIDDGRVQAKLVTPSGVREIERELSPWLR